MKVGILTASASRQAGGLLWAMAPLARRLSELNCEVEVFAGRDRYSEEDRPHWGQVPLRVFDKIGPGAFGYMAGLSRQIKNSQLDVLHTHGLWMYPSVAASVWGLQTSRPWLVSPHGMLDPWAVGNARWKKRLAGLFYENRNLRGAACLHALCEAEADAFRAYGLTNPIAVIPNGVDLPELPSDPLCPEWAADVPDGARVLLFLGRLHPKKGLPNFLRAWAQQNRASDASWILAIAGWDQNDHCAELERLAQSLGIFDTVRFVGPQFGSQKEASLMRADAFVLPSFSEGLPMAVLEAWAHQRPVVMTPQCNLPEGFAAAAAICAEPEVDSLGRGLATLFSLSHPELLAMGHRGRQLVESQFTWPYVGSQMCEVYRWVLGQGERPGCVVVE